MTEIKKSDVSRLKVGDRLSETQYYEVLTIAPSGTVEVKNERGFTFGIGYGIVEEGIFSADQFNEEVFLTRTELIKRFAECGDTVFTVNYHKQAEMKDINDAIESVNRGKILPIAEIKKLVKTAYKGEERTLTGYLISVETGFGRSLVIDLKADASKSTPATAEKAAWDSRIRQVDHRSLNWLIQKNIKYTVKK